MASSQLRGLSINCVNLIYIDQTIPVNIILIPATATVTTIDWVAKNSSGDTLDSSVIEFTKSSDGTSGTIKLKTALPNDASSFIFTVSSGEYISTLTIEQAETILSMSINLGLGGIFDDQQRFIIGYYYSIPILLNITTNLNSNSSNFPKSFSSSNFRILIVTSQGLLMGLNTGTVTLTGKSFDYKERIVQYTIIVQPIDLLPIPINALDLVIGDVYTGKDTRIDILPSPVNVLYDIFTYSSDNNAVAYVAYIFLADRSYIFIRGISPGTANISVTLRDYTTNRNTITKTIPVTVKMTIDAIISKTSIIRTGTVYTDTFANLVTLYPTSSSSLAPELLWSSSNNKIATISKNSTGVTITPVAIGTTTIYATSHLDKDVSSMITVIVENNLNAFTTNIPATLSVDRAITLKVSATGENGKAATYTSISFVSSDPSVALIYNNTSIIGLAAGTCNITTTVTGSNQTLTSISSITIISVIKSINITPNLQLLEYDNTPQTISLVAEIFPTSVSNNTIIWRSSNTSIVNITANSTNSHNATAIVSGVGTANITATAQDTGKVVAIVPFIIDSTDHIIGIDIYKVDNNISTRINNLKFDITSGPGITSTLNVSTFPDNANNSDITWTSSNSSVVSISPDPNDESDSKKAVITALMSGSAIITIKSVSTDEILKTIPVTVGKRITSVLITGIPSQLYSGTTAQLTLQLTPADAIAESIIWTYTNDLGDLTSSGVIIAPTDTDIEYADGNVLTIPANAISVSVSNQFMSSPLTSVINSLINIRAKVTSISLNSYISIDTNVVTALTSTILPEYAFNKALTWVSDNQAVVAVDSDGNVIGNTGGIAIIKATTTDGSNLSASIIVESVNTGSAYMPVIIKPLISDILLNRITVRWNYVGTEGGASFLYKVVMFNNFALDVIDNSGDYDMINTYTFTGLTSFSNYRFQVLAIDTSDDSVYYSKLITYRTINTTYTPVIIKPLTDDILARTIRVRWNYLGTEGGLSFLYKVVMFNNFTLDVIDNSGDYGMINTYSFTGLTPLSNYRFQVLAIDTSDDSVYYSKLITYRTNEIVFYINTNIITTNTISISWIHDTVEPYTYNVIIKSNNDILITETGFTISTLYHQFYSLQSSTTYKLQVIARTNEPIPIYLYSPIKIYTTANPEPLVVSFSNPDSVDIEYNQIKLRWSFNRPANISSIHITFYGIHSTVRELSSHFPSVDSNVLVITDGLQVGGRYRATIYAIETTNGGETITSNKDYFIDPTLFYFLEQRDIAPSSVKIAWINNNPDYVYNISLYYINSNGFSVGNLIKTSGFISLNQNVSSYTSINAVVYEYITTGINIASGAYYIQVIARKYGHQDIYSPFKICVTGTRTITLYPISKYLSTPSSFSIRWTLGTPLKVTRIRIGLTNLSSNSEEIEVFNGIINNSNYIANTRTYIITGIQLDTRYRVIIYARVGGDPEYNAEYSEFILPTFSITKPITTHVIEWLHFRDVSNYTYRIELYNMNGIDDANIVFSTDFISIQPYTINNNNNCVFRWYNYDMFINTRLVRIVARKPGQQDIYAS